MSTAFLLDELAERGIELRAENGKLRFRAPEGALIPSLKRRLAEHREELLVRLSGGGIPEPEILQIKASPTQERLWFVDQLQGPNFTYNIPMALHLRGSLDANALHAAMDDMLTHQQSLRAGFRHDGQKLLMEIAHDVRIPWTTVDLTGLNDEEKKTRLAEIGESVSGHCFNLATPPLIIATLAKLSDRENILFFNVHHIAADGWSCALILKEIATAYECRTQGKEPLDSLHWQYVDYLEWQDFLRENGAMEADLEFWRQKLTDAPEFTTIPADRERPPVQSFTGRVIPVSTDSDTTERLRERARQFGVTANQLFLAAAAALIARFSGQDDIVIGMPLANRTRRELEPIVGMFVNTLPLRFHIRPDMSLSALMEEVRRANTEAIQHANLPFEKLVTALVKRRDPGRTPIFQIAYNFLPPIDSSFQFGGLAVESEESHAGKAISKYDITFYFDDLGDRIKGHIEYSDKLYRSDSAKRWVDALDVLLRAIADGRDGTLEELFDSATPRQLSWAQCTGPECSLSEESPWERFLVQAQSHSERIAVEEGGNGISYGELKRRAEIVSALLAEKGVKKGSRVGLLLARGCDHVTALLGVMRLGAVFVPFDATQPAERLEMMAERAKLSALVRGRGMSLASMSSESIEISPDVWKHSGSIPESTPTSREDPVYMIFTSGSTGVPKGVLVPWQGLNNIACLVSKRFQLDGTRVSQIASTSFDASILEIIPTLFSGATLVIVPDETRLDPEALRDWILLREIAVHFSPTPLAEALLELNWPKETPLKLLTTGGQTLHRRPRADTPFQVMNMYGPTETSILVTMSDVTPDEDDADLPTIGSPVENTAIVVLDASGNPVKVGEKGELCATGAGIALGYFDEEAETRKNFVVLENDPEKRRWYRTGDMVRLRGDGELDYIGRKDRQIKLRGYRIESGDVESAIMQAPGIRQAAVRAEGDILAAYVETIGAGAENAMNLRAFLANTLPSWMIPSRFTAMEKLPRQASGKIDLSAIPFPQKEPSGTSRTAGTHNNGTLVAAVTRAWADVLGMSNPGMDDNFFDLGGHSLMLMRLKERLHSECGLEIGVMDLFRNPTISRQAAFLAGESELRPESPGPLKPAGNKSAVAIIGMAGRFPEAENVEEFWQNLCGGHECIRFFSRDELLAAGVPAELADNPNYVPANGILREIGKFDARFFGITDREAQILDPQQRLLLEEAWHCFEDAGIDPAGIKERVGVYVGSSMNGYVVENVLPRRDIMEGIGGWAVMVANDKDFSATRLSYKLNLRGPSVSVNTACSTSLVAVHQAVTALHDGQCEMALAGGSCVRSRQVDGYLWEDGGILSKDGHCRAFDAEATGMAGGSGVALVLLKPLEKALSDGDPIYAVIKGIAANNDGSDKIGFTAPGIRGQSEVIADALARAEVSPDNVGYVETHGTGTKLGDSIEVAALAENYAGANERKQPLMLGSVKTNVGHLDAASGVTGLIKAALCLSKRTLVPSLHFKTPSPDIQWPGNAFQVCTQTARFEGDTPRHAAVSSLGIGGTNVHAILEEAPERPTQQPDDERPCLLLFSGMSEKALHDNAMTVGRWLERHEAAGLCDVAQTLAFGRHHWPERFAIAAAGATEAVERLKESPLRVSGANATAFLFTGMGTQKPGMGRALYENAPVFRQILDKCATLLQPVLNLDIRKLLLADPSDEEAMTALNRHHIGQPAVFALEYATAHFWMNLGIVPDVLIGHSLGELVAATVAGVFRIEDALPLVSKRGALMDSMEKGAMLAVNLTEAEVAAALPETLDIATVNALDQIVVAGPAEEIEKFACELEAREIRCKRIAVTLAAHSPLMEPALPEFEAAVAAVERRIPDGKMEIISNITGQVVAPEALTDPSYWSRHLRSCVRFADGLATLWNRPSLALLECGPSHTLCNIALRDARKPDQRPILATLDGDDDPAMEWKRVMESAGTLWAAGLPLNLERLFTMLDKGRRISLPGYAFQRKRYWLDAVSIQAPSGDAVARPATQTEQPEEEEDTTWQASPSASEKERLVIDRMHELLGNIRITPTSDFFLCGGDSLLAVRLATRISETTGTHLTRADVMKGRTPAKIALLLENDVSTKSETEPVIANKNCLMRLWRGDENLPPIVLIHAVGGGAFIYRDLLRAMQTRHPVWGIQAPELWEDSVPPPTLRAQAESYHRALVESGVRRPAMLGGSSYGGIVSFELARIYSENDFTCPMIAMFDSPGPGHMPASLSDDAELFACIFNSENPGIEFAAEVRRIRQMDQRQREDQLLHFMNKKLMPGATAQDARRFLCVFHSNLANMYAWNGNPSQSPIVFFKALENSGTMFAQAPELGWVPLAQAGIQILPSPGNHSSMLDSPNVDFIAERLNHVLSESSFSTKVHPIPCI